MPRKELRASQTNALIDLRRLKVMQMLEASCYTMAHMAQECGVSRATISRDIEAVRRWAQDGSVAIHDSVKAKILAGISMGKRLALEGYHRSLGDEQVIEQEMVEHKGANLMMLKKKKVTTRAGTPAFVGAYNNLLRLEAEVEGLIGRDRFDEIHSSKETPQLIPIVVKNYEQAQQMRRLAQSGGSLEFDAATIDEALIPAGDEDSDDESN